MKFILVSRFRGCRVGILALAIVAVAGATQRASAKIIETSAEIIETKAVRSIGQQTDLDQPPTIEDAPLPVSAADAPDEPKEPGTTAGTGDPHRLSVPPLDHATYPEDRPAWVDAAPELDGEVAVWPVKSLLRHTPEEAAESLRIQIWGASAAYAEHILGEQRAGRLGDHALLRITPDDIPAEDSYTGAAQLGEQTVYEQAVRLRFDEDYRQRLLAAWQEREVGRRLSSLGIVGGAGLCLLVAGTGLVRRFARPTANA